MRKYIVFFIVALLAFSIACSTESFRAFTKSGYTFSGKKKIALVNVYVQSRRDLTSSRRNIMAEYELQLKKKNFQVISQSEIEKALKSLELPYDREYTIEEIKKLKEKLSCDVIVQGFVSEESESLISDEMNINFHFKYYDGQSGEYVGEALYQYQGTDTIIMAKFVKVAVTKVLAPFGIKND